MITPAEIYKKALRQYKSFLSAVLRKERFFPLHIKGNRGKANDEYEQLFRGITRLLESEKQKKGYGYTVILKTVNTRQAGKISMPDAIFFENVEDYVRFIEKEKEFLNFRKAVRLTHKQVPELKTWIAENPLKTVKYLSIWEDLLRVCRFLIENPQPDLYPRAVPVVSASTFIEDNQKILTELLSFLSLNSADSPVFEKRFGLNADEVLVRMRSLSGGFTGLPVSDISLKIVDWKELEIEENKVFFMTDKLNFLRFPKFEDALAVLVTDENEANLKALDFFKNKKLYFWGDLTINGMTQLSTLRKSFPNLTSFLMEAELLKKYENIVRTVKGSNKEIILHLTTEEQELLTILEQGKELLQKHILQEDIENVLHYDR